MSTTVTQEHIGQIRDARTRSKAGIMDKAMCVRVQFKKPGRIRKVATQAQVLTADPSNGAQGALIDSAPVQEKTNAVPLINEQVKTDLTLIRVSKYIMEAEEVQAVAQLDHRIVKYLQTKALPSIFQWGVYLVPDELIGEVDLVLGNFLESRKTLVAAAVAAYPRIIQDAEQRLGDMFDLTNYLSPEQFEKAYDFRWDYMSYGVEERLKLISKQTYDREVEKSKERFAEAENEIKFALREAMSELINHAVERLTPDENGKAKMLAKGRYTALTEFLDTFKNRNICEDQELERLVKQAHDLISGQSREDLTKNEGLHGAVLHGFNDVKTALDAMLVDRPKRKMRFDVEEGGAGE